MSKLDYKLANFPIMVFAIVMGLSGLVIVLDKAAFLLNFPRMLYWVLLSADIAIFSGLLAIYAAKMIRFPEKVAEEFAHPIRINFFPTISISLLLLSIAFYNQMNPVLGIFFWYLGAPLHFIFSFVVIRYWFEKKIEFHHYNPAWFIPVVGLILIPIVGVEIAPQSISIFAYAVGFFFWVALFTIFLYRVTFHHPIAQKFIPTLFILVAPPAIALISYVRITMQFDIFAAMLYGLVILFVLLLAMQWRSFVLKEFFLSWWAFTFPAAAATISTMLVYELFRLPIFRVASFVFIAVTLFWVGLVFIKTIRAAADHAICIEE